MKTTTGGAPAAELGDVVRELGLQSVFVAAPFFSLVDPAIGRMPSLEQGRVERLLNHFESRGCTVFNAHRRERWGEAFLEPEAFTRLDFDEISRADALVAIPGVPASAGTHIEIGWASALGKPIVLVLERDAAYAGMLSGLHRVAPTAVIEAVGGAIDMSELDTALRTVCRADMKWDGVRP